VFPKNTEVQPMAVSARSEAVRRYWISSMCAFVHETPSPEPRKPRLLDRVREEIRKRHYSRRTEKSYIGWIRRFILFHGKRHPAEPPGSGAGNGCSRPRASTWMLLPGESAGITCTSLSSRGLYVRRYCVPGLPSRRVATRLGTPLPRICSRMVTT